ncbi:MAG: hypothetical protein KF850_30235 [Labilithrix sp.]|nr:hypothetical protein [Labilithrix sp.]
MRGTFRGAWVGGLVFVSACGGGSSAVRPACPAGQSSLDGTCVSQAIADYVGCIRATGATVASDSSQSLSAAAGTAGVTASTQADVKDKLERHYATVSDNNTLEVIRNCYAKTGTAVVSAPASEVVLPARAFAKSKAVAVGATAFGANLVTNGPPFTSTANMVEYEVSLAPGGSYDLWAEYAAAETRPSEIRFNGELVAEGGLREVTGGWNESDCKWFKEATVTARDARNVLTVRRSSYFPHIKAFKFVPR